MRALLLLSACILIVVGALVSGPGDALSDCASIRGSCINHCFDRETNAARLSACRNRCAIQFCQDPPAVCRPTDQSVCNTSFGSCNGACESATTVPSAIAQNQIACSRTCCVRYKACLSLRSCDVSTIICP
jgi:hypothetical protein